MAEPISTTGTIILSATSRTGYKDLSRGWLALALVLFVLIWLASLGARPLVHTDEGRYAALALEMARNGDFITPRLNGLLYFEKPPLQYWISALSIRLFGPTEFAARLWPGMAGLLTVFAVGLTAGRLWGRTSGVQAFAIAGSTTWIIALSHVLTLDAGLTLFLTLTLCAVLLAECADLQLAMRHRCAWVAWLSMACAVLSKGLVGIVIPCGAVLVASLWMRDFGLMRRMRPAVGLLMLIAVAGPWFVLVSVRNPGFAEFFFIHEHFARYLTQGAPPSRTVVVLPSVVACGHAALDQRLVLAPATRQDVVTASESRAARILAAWCGFVLVFFSLSGSKLPAYILPMFPALVLLVTLQLRAAGVPALRWHLLVPLFFWALALFASTQLYRFASNETPQAALDALGSALRAGALLFLVGAAAAFWFLDRRRITAAVLSVAIGHFAATTVVMQGYDALGQVKSAAALSEVLLPLIGPMTPVFAVRCYDQTLPFYLRRNVTLVEYTDEFAFGQQHEPEKSPITLDEFIERWRSLPQGAAYMTRESWRELRERGVPMRVVFEDARHLVVMKS